MTLRTRSLAVTLVVFLTLIPHPASSDGGNDTSTQSPDLRAPALIKVKIFCLVIVFAATFVGGISPCFCRWNQSFLVLGTQFAGGVFLGTALLHFLADSNNGFESLVDKTYPFAFMLAAAGYLLTMFGDCIIQWIFSKKTTVSSLNSLAGERSAGDSGEPESKDIDACTCGENVEVPVSGKHFVAATLVKTTSLGDTILLILALCFHSVFEGIAIGIAATTNDAWTALWTISLHKVFAAIAMGIALLRMIPNRPLLTTAMYSFAFAISSPIGIAIGILIDATTQGPAADWMYAIAMGLACGVFIYVAINHLLAKGYVPDCRVKVDTLFCRFLAVTLGVGVMAVVMIWD